MPKRKFGTRRIETPDLQGESSYVILRDLRRGDARFRDLLDSARAGRGELEVNDLYIIASVNEWNWVDDEGNALPLPKDSLSCVECGGELTADDEGNRKCASDPSHSGVASRVLQDMPAPEYAFLVNETSARVAGEIKKSETSSESTSGRAARRPR